MNKKLWCLILTCLMAICTVAGVSFASGAVKAEPELKFLNVYMGGQDWSNSQPIPPQATTWGEGIGLTFTANVYNQNDSTTGNGYVTTMHDLETAVEGEGGAKLKNKDLVEYKPADSADPARTVYAIWYDTLGAIKFSFNGDVKSTDPEAVDPISGVPYAVYGDGDQVTVKAGFAYKYGNGMGADKTVTLKNDVTVEYSAENMDWFEVIPAGGQSQFVPGKTGADIKVKTGGVSGYPMWGFTIDMFTDANRPAPYEAYQANDKTKGSLKKVARTDTGGAARAFWWAKNNLQYIESDGTERDINYVYITDNAQMCLRTAGSDSAAKGDKIVIKRGFRAGYYYGALGSTDYGEAWGHFGAFQPVATVSEDVLFVNNGEAWVLGIPADSAEFTTEISEIYQGQSVRLEIELSEGCDEVPQYSSSDPEAVAVSNTGVITGGAKAGEAVITAKFARVEASITVTNKTTIEKRGISAGTDAKLGKIVVYKGVMPTKQEIINQIWAKYVYANGFDGEEIELTDADIDLTGYDKESTAEQTVTVSRDGYEAELKTKCYTVSSTTAPTDYMNLSAWSGQLAVLFNHLTADTSVGVKNLKADELERLGVFDTFTLKKAEKDGGGEIEVEEIAYIYKYWVAFIGAHAVDLTPGTTLELKEGFSIYYLDEGAPVAAYTLSEAFKAVYDGTFWQPFTAEASGVEPEKEQLELPVGGYHKLAYSILPAGSYILPVITSSNPDVIAIENGYLNVLAASAEPVEIYIQLGTDESTRKTITVTVTAEEANGVAIFEPRVYGISKDGTVDLSILRGMLTYPSGGMGEPFALNEENTAVGEFDNVAPGEKHVQLTVTVDEVAYTTGITVKVEPYYEQIPGGIMTNPWGGNNPQLVIDFGKTFDNRINMPMDKVPGLANVKDYIDVLRGTEKLKYSVSFNGQFMVITVDAPGETFQADDTIVLKSGLVFWKWAGDAVNYNPVGEGDYVTAGEIAYEVTFVYTNPANKGWNTYIYYEGIEVLEDPITVPLGKLKDPGAVLIPKYATVGDLAVVSNDTSVVSVSAAGLLKGEKIGSTTITITATGGDEPVTLTVTVNVIDTAESIQFNKESFNVAPGTSLNAQVLQDKGITAQFKWASGKVEGDVDFSNATFTGFDSAKTGEQTVTVRVMYDGRSVTGTITVKVGDEKKGCGGCGTLGAGGAAGIGGVLLITFAVLTLTLRKKKSRCA